MQDLRFAGALNLTHLLQLGVDGAERAGDHDVGECVIVHGHAQHDGDGAVSQPVGNGNAQTGQEAVGAGGGVAEHGQPGQSLGPGGDHIRYGHQQAQDLLAGEIRADHQPRQNGAKRHRNQHGEKAADKGVLQRPPQHGAGQLTGEDVFPVVQGEIAHVTLDPAQLALSQRKGAGDHGQQRDDDEAEQDDETDQHHHVKGVFQHIQDQVL